ncbi:MAG: TetR/AcrR family transcriptional regulator [Myxococcales bacterium]|nr:TetR/AcrR family transcriptional regulator [Myxococcales bacterium]
MKKGEQTKQRMIEVAARLFQRQGYHGTGLNQVLQESQAPKGSMYFHFPEGKEELAEAAIAYAGELTQQAILETMGDARSLEEALQRVILYFEGAFLRSDGEDGCPVALLAMEMAPYSERLQVACAAVYRDWTLLIAGYLEGMGFPDELREVWAEWALLVVEGALLLSRTYRSIKPLEQAAAMLVQQAQHAEQALLTDADTEVSLKA